jgi:hypothetical protein
MLEFFLISKKFETPNYWQPIYLHQSLKSQGEVPRCPVPIGYKEWGKTETNFKLKYTKKTFISDY